MPRERILAFGKDGTGKTYAWMRLAKRFKGATFHVIDSELGAERSLEEFPELAVEVAEFEQKKGSKDWDFTSSGEAQVTIYPVIDWPEYRAAQKIAVREARPGDWIILDMADKPWSAVQRHFVGQIFDQEMGDYYLKARQEMQQADKKGKSLNPLDGWVDWQVINRMYQDFMLPLAFRSRANLFMTSSVSVPGRDSPKEIRDLYGPLGCYPSGQKDLPHQPDTILLFIRTGFDEYSITTAKDRGKRDYWEKEMIVDFPKQYGMLAGWDKVESPK